MNFLKIMMMEQEEQVILMEEVQQEELQEADLDKTGCTNEREMIKCQI